MVWCDTSSILRQRSHRPASCQQIQHPATELGWTFRYGMKTLLFWVDHTANSNNPTPPKWGHTKGLYQTRGDSLGTNHHRPHHQPRTNQHPTSTTHHPNRKSVPRPPPRPSAQQPHRIRTQNRQQNPRRNRRPPPIQKRRTARLLRRTRPRKPPLRQKHQPHQPTPRRQPPPQKRHVPRRLHSLTTRPPHQGKRSEGKHHNAAIICVARRRCNLILAMLKNQTTYNPNRPKTDLTKR